MPAHAEAGGEPRTIERRAQEATGQGAAIRVIPGGIAIGFDMAPDAEFTAGQDEGGVEQLAMAEQVAIRGAQPFEGHGDAIARLDVALEVDLMGQRADQGMGKRRGHAGAGQGQIDAADDGRLDAREVALAGDDLLLHHPAIALSTERDGAARGGLDLQREEGIVPVGGEAEADLLPDGEAAGREDGGKGADGLMRLGLADTGAGEQLPQRVAAADSQDALGLGRWFRCCDIRDGGGEKGADRKGKAGRRRHAVGRVRAVRGGPSR